MRFSLVTLFVEDPAPLRDWYTRHLGLGVHEETPRFVRLADSSGRPCVAFHVGQPVEHPERAELHFEVDDVDSTYRRLSSEGVTFTAAPEDKAYGWRVASLVDPAGHTVELVSPLVADH